MNKSDAILPLAQDADPVSDMVDNERDEAELVKSRRLILLLALLNGSDRRMGVVCDPGRGFDRDR